jgi:pilus assembly protein FimV
LNAVTADDLDPNADSLSSEMLSSQWEIDSGFWDEAGTKMDLARAYIEMEDPDAARTILKEVLVEGSEEQQGEASTLLAKLG